MKTENGKRRKTPAKKMVMQPEFKMRVVPNHKKYKRERDNGKVQLSRLWDGTEN